MTIIQCSILCVFVGVLAGCMLSTAVSLDNIDHTIYELQALITESICIAQKAEGDTDGQSE